MKIKDLMIWTSPTHEFNEEVSLLVKLQIDNKRRMGVPREDILLFTNFPYQYDGVISKVVPDIYCDIDRTSNKIPVILYLLENKLLEDALYHYHDFDCYQNDTIFVGEQILGSDFALSKYGYKDEWQCGAFWFKPSALTIFREWVNRMVRDRTRLDEKTMREMIKDGWMTGKFSELNVSYNFTFRYPHRNYPNAIIPLMCVHFHPNYQDKLMDCKAIEIFRGNNKLNTPLLSAGLDNLFKKYGF